MWNEHIDPDYLIKRLQRRDNVQLNLWELSFQQRTRRSKLYEHNVTQPVLCCAVLCCAVLCCDVCCCAVLCCAVMCCTVLYCAVFCCAVLSCAVLFTTTHTLTHHEHKHSLLTVE